MAKVSRSNVKQYPDISHQLKEKDDRRKQLAKLPVETKLRMVAKMRDAQMVLHAAKDSRKRDW